MIKNTKKIIVFSENMIYYTCFGMKKEIKEDM